MASRSALLLSFTLLVSLSPPFARADKLTITSRPSGASVEIDGVMAGTTPHKTERPGGYFHKNPTPLGRPPPPSMNARNTPPPPTTQKNQITQRPTKHVSP